MHGTCGSVGAEKKRSKNIQKNTKDAILWKHEGKKILPDTDTCREGKVILLIYSLPFTSIL